LGTVRLSKHQFLIKDKNGIVCLVVGDVRMFRSRSNNFIGSKDIIEKRLQFFNEFKIFCPKIVFLAQAFDLLLLVLASTFVKIVFPYGWLENFVTVKACLAVGIVNSFLYVYAARGRGLYQLAVLLLPVAYFGRLLAIFASTAFLVTGSLFILKGNLDISPWPLVAIFSLQLLLLVISRLVLAKATCAILSAGNLVGRLVVTVGEPAELMGLSASYLLQHYGLKEVFRMPIDDTSEVLADLDRAITIAKDRRAEEFLIALHWGNQELFEAVLSRLRALPLPIRLLPDHSIRILLEQRGGLTDALLLPVTLQRLKLSSFERAVKRALDLIVSSMAIVFCLPLFLIVAIAIKLDSPGPVIFRQRRRGFNAKEFIIFKFRTMTVLEDGSVVTQACRDDHRVTFVGKFLRRSSLDELPQLFNVLWGDMSLVGPRPHALAHDDHYRVHIADYACRHYVKPGITGWAQVNGLRGETASFEQMADRVKLDLWYINNWSLGLDLNILLQTCFEILRDRAY
jgi:putative colanic acid biosysnthesis UDP-glucose lipid carrier transferase